MVAGEKDQGLGFQAGVYKGLEMHGFHGSREISRQVGRRGRQGLWQSNLGSLQALNSHRHRRRKVMGNQNASKVERDGPLYSWTQATGTGVAWPKESRVWWGWRVVVRVKVRRDRSVVRPILCKRKLMGCH